VLCWFFCDPQIAGTARDQTHNLRSWFSSQVPLTCQPWWPLRPCARSMDVILVSRKLVFEKGRNKFAFSQHPSSFGCNSIIIWFDLILIAPKMMEHKKLVLMMHIRMYYYTVQLRLRNRRYWNSHQSFSAQNVFQTSKRYWCLKNDFFFKEEERKNTIRW